MAEQSPGPGMFGKILIANRGEIACRIARTARRLGIATVAVYSDADANALHVQLADEAVHIGPAPARESYLATDRILDAARRTGAQAIHPGYGFLSENAAFAAACADAGLVFIGPPTAAIEAMGSKAAAKRIMAQANVPLIPGYHGADQSPETLRAAAAEIGYPVLLKASAGGGGKGMRRVEGDREFEAALEAARREASSSFGDEAMLVEKLLERPRHVEIQVFFDRHGNGVYLAERDCSLQRRHQKVIEEAPAPGLPTALRNAMGESAVRAARAIDYVGAGTVEFLLDETGAFYFMEMNTRLQVEHPVTEMITGIDLVAWQLQVAAGFRLPLEQSAVSIRGHAFEARVYAEDPANDFLPATGRLTFLQAPEDSRHVRVDTGVTQGDEISMYYDPMIAKLVVWDENRERALQRLARALADYRIGGTVTNVEFLYNLATHPAFARAELETGFIQLHRESIFRDSARDLAQDLPIAALAVLLHRRETPSNRAAADPWSPWQAGNAWRLNEPHVHRLLVQCHGQEHAVEIEQRADHYQIRAAGQQAGLAGRLEGDTLYFEREGHRQRANLAAVDGQFTLFLPGGAIQFHEVLPDTGEAAGGPAAGALSAPMNGTVVALLAEPGDTVEAGQGLIVMEAMKMEHTLRAPGPGTVRGYHFAAGDLVDGGTLLVDFEPEE